MNKGLRKIKKIFSKSSSQGLFSLVKEYKFIIAVLIIISLLVNALKLFIPEIISQAIDTYTNNTFVFWQIFIEFSTITIGILIFSYGQAIIRTYASEKVARDLREKLSLKISQQSLETVQTVGSAKLLTNLTSDVDAVKRFISLIVISIVSSVVLIIGTSILLLILNWRLALVVLSVIPIIGGSFYFVFYKIRTLFHRSREIIDWLNKVINESILGAILVRVLSSEKDELYKFTLANSDARDNGIGIVRLFSILVPIISLVASLGGLAVLVLGGYFVITGSMTLGNFAAFQGYILILIFPIIRLGFMSNIIAQATVSYARIQEILTKDEKKNMGTIQEKITGDIKVENLSLSRANRPILKKISFHIAPKSKVAVIGPTAAGKSQLLHLLIGLITPTEGEIYYDDKAINEYDSKSLHQSVGFVFQDSVIFNISLRENIAFNQTVTVSDMEKAIHASELDDFISSLPEGLETSASERGLRLSGGQKQRIMLARALALQPQILLLDDFTARVDTQTEKKILKNIEEMYPNITLISVVQKISSIKHYDKIILLMEGEKLAEGTHAELMKTSPEYVQILDSQKTTERT